MSADERVGRCFAVGGALVFLAVAWIARDFVPDAAWISERYARNLAAGLGPVWNEGGPRVEGFGAPALLAVHALALRAGLDGIATLQALGLLAGLATIGTTWRQGRVIFGPHAAGVAAFFLGATPAMACWAMGALETLPLMLLQAWVLFDAARPDGGSPRRAGWLLALVPWLRPEGPLLALFLAVCISNGRPDARARLVAIGLPILASVLVLEGLRLAVFGHLVPNPAMVRFGTQWAPGTLTEFMTLAGPLLPFAAMAVLLAPQHTWGLAVPAAVLLLGPLLYMDQITEFGRHLLPVFPAWCLLGARGLVALTETRPGWVGTAIGAGSALVLAGVLLCAPEASVTAVAEFADEYDTCREEVRRQAGEYVRDRLGAGERYAVTDSGLLPVVAGGEAYDLFGINDPDVARMEALAQPVRAGAVIASAPAWMVLRSDTFAAPMVPRYSLERALVALPELDAAYAHVHTAHLPGCDYYLWVYRQR